MRKPAFLHQHSRLTSAEGFLSPKLVTYLKTEGILYMNTEGNKISFKRKACQVYDGGCCRQVSTVVSLVVW